MLRVLGEVMNFRVHVTPPVEVEGQVVSSSHIRRLLMDGHVEQAQQMLGRPYRLSGRVIRGDGRGRTIGIPTANLAVPEEKICPAVGVYACRTTIGGLTYAAATNIGTRPTFDGRETMLHVEAHILDLDEDLYDQPVSLEFLARLRGEQRFPSIEALVTQIDQDIQRTRELVLGKINPKGIT
jgi:riboflavin kinase/FMN adenylyltransferase